MKPFGDPEMLSPRAATWIQIGSFAFTSARFVSIIEPIEFRIVALDAGRGPDRLTQSPIFTDALGRDADPSGIRRPREILTDSTQPFVCFEHAYERLQLAAILAKALQ
jgi:hypothetical protein